MLAANQINSFYISPYYVLLLVGTLGMFLCAHKRRGLFSLSSLQCFEFTILLTATGVAGAMILFFIESGSFGGVSFFGSVFFIPMIMPLLGRIFRLKPGQTMDICGPCVAIMIGFMRMNCFISGCCGGWDVCIGGICFAWPTQAIDSIFDFVILIGLLNLEVAGKARKALYPLFMLSYSTMRFFVEFLRDTPKECIGMSNGQWFAIVAIIVSFIWLFLIRRKGIHHANST